MQFGKTDDPEGIDFTLPKDHPDTKRILSNNKPNSTFNVYVGCAKWNKTDLKNFYPKGTKDELTYYATQFNSIELNATFYKSPSRDQVEKWKEKATVDFKFFPKIPNTISHFKRLIDVKSLIEEFTDSVVLFNEKLGMCFLQMHDNFKPKDINRLDQFLKDFPSIIPLAVELRNEEWYLDKKNSDALYELLLKYQRTFVLVDTAGRRDLLHMRLSSSTAFVRYVGANHESDYKRLDDWIERIKIWKKEGLQELYFFVHQNVELESPLLSAYFIEKINKEFKLNLKIPKTLTGTK
jgi:uncharacterized protein YecE (DUF72 family)